MPIQNAPYRVFEIGGPSPSEKRVPQLARALLSRIRVALYLV